MNKQVLLNIIQGNNIVLPMYLLSRYKELKLELNEFVFLMYIHSIGNKTIFNPTRYSEDFGWSLNEVMDIINSLSEKKYVEIKVIKNDKNIMEEVILIDGFYNKINMTLIGKISDNDDKDSSDIYSYMEEQFGRTLNSFDHEIIMTWIEGNVNEELIKAAVDEAVNNGVSNVKYIDKILYDWSKKDIDSVSDLDKYKKKKTTGGKKDEVNDDVDLDMVDWDWLGDE